MGNKSSRGSGEGDDSDADQLDDRNNRSSSGQQQQQQQQQQSQSYYSMIKDSYGALVNAIIRPPRCEYSLDQLGPSSFHFCGRNFERIDFTLRNPRGLLLQCSWWGPTAQHRHNAVLPCVVYMHGNSSARVEALSSLSLALGIGATLLAFDFSGSGLSEGEYVSLGFFERDDLQCVIEHLRQSGSTSTIALWGRSMGAATALMHGERDPSIAALVLDSAFTSLQSLSEEMVEKARQQGMFAPGLLVAIVIKFIRSSVQKRADFDIKALAPIDNADKCFIPAMFIAAEGDHFVPKHHSQMIHDKYGGDKNIVIVEGDHNSPRPKFLFDSIGIFLVTTLQIPNDWILPDSQSFIRKTPWHRSAYTAQTMRQLDGLPTTAATAARGGAITSTAAAAVATAGGGNSQLEEMQRQQQLYLQQLQVRGLSDGNSCDLTMDELLALSMMQEEEEDIDLVAMGIADSDLAMQSNIQHRVNSLLSGGKCSTEQLQKEFAQQLNVTSNTADSNSMQQQQQQQQQQQSPEKGKIKVPLIDMSATSQAATSAAAAANDYSFPTKLSPRSGPSSNIGVAAIATTATAASNNATSNNCKGASGEETSAAARILAADSPAVSRKTNNNNNSNNNNSNNNNNSSNNSEELFKMDSLSQLPFIDVDDDGIDSCKMNPPPQQQQQQQQQQMSSGIAERRQQTHRVTNTNDTTTTTTTTNTTNTAAAVKSQLPPMDSLQKHPRALTEMSSTFFNTYGPGQPHDVNATAVAAATSDLTSPQYQLLASDSSFLLPTTTTSTNATANTATITTWTCSACSMQNAAAAATSSSRNVCCSTCGVSKS